MPLQQAAKIFKELGHPTRLALFKRIVKAGTGGLSVGHLQQELQIPGSTLSHHISGLISASLVNQRREGRTLYCVAAYDELESIIEYLRHECCHDGTQPNPS